MEAVNQSGPSGTKRRRRSKANTSNQEDPNVPEPDKDGKLRDRRNNCWIEVENLICDVMDGDRSIRTTGPWEGREKKVIEANKRLQDPLVILGKLRKLIAPSIMGNPGVETALQVVESCLKMSKNPVTNQENTNGISGLVKKLQNTKEEVQFQSNQLKQNTIVGDHKDQLLKEAKAFTQVSKMLSDVSISCCYKANEIASLPIHVPGQFLETKDEELVFHFPPPLDSTKINQHGDSRMIDQEEPEKEVGLTIAYAEKRLAKLTLKMPKNDREMVLPALLNADVSNQTDAPCNLDNPQDLAGNSRENEANMDTSNVVTSKFRTYSVDPSNAKHLIEMVQKHPNIDEKFRLEFPYFQNHFMDALAFHSRHLEHFPDMYEIDGIRNVELLVKDMEFTGLETSYLKKKIEKVREMLENKLQYELDGYRAKEKETEEKLALLKRPRLE